MEADRVLHAIESVLSSDHDVIESHRAVTAAALGISCTAAELYTKAMQSGPGGTLTDAKVLGRPRGIPTQDPRAGDVLVRRARGMRRLDHVAVLAESELRTLDELLTARERVESAGPGLYGIVIEGGARPHRRQDRFWRRILDSGGAVPADQILLRSDAEPPELEWEQPQTHEEADCEAAERESSADLYLGDVYMDEAEDEEPGDQVDGEREDHGVSPAGTRDWTGTSENERMRHVVNLLVSRYGYPLNGAAGVVGNLYAESGVLPNRVEGSRPATPMRARNFAGVMTDFSAEQIMNRNRSRQEGPRLPGVGLAQWTSSERRAGLFRHVFQNRTPGASILFDMDAQVDYLVSELGARYRAVDSVLRNPSMSLAAASDEVVYNFEVPGAVLTTTEPRRKLPRSDGAVIDVFEQRRRYSANALAAAQGSSTSEAWPMEASWSEQLDEEQFKQAVLEQQISNALARSRTRYAPVSESELAVVEGGHRLRIEAAKQCRALLSAARDALAEAQRAGSDGDAARVTQIGIASSYRDPAYDARLWHRYFPRYYRRTQAHREELVGGPHGDAAVRFLARFISRRKAAPGFSNHSDGRAVDFTTTEGGLTFGPNTSQRVGWRRTWLHRWLVPNAEHYGFYPLATEEWHWEYRMGSRR